MNRTQSSSADREEMGHVTETLSEDRVVIAELGKDCQGEGSARVRPRKEGWAAGAVAEAQGERRQAVDVTVIEVGQEPGSGRPASHAEWDPISIS